MACSGEKPRSSSTLPRVTCVGLLVALFTFLLLCQSRLYDFEPPPCFLKIFSWHLLTFLLETMENIDHVFYPRQVNHAIPRSFILVPQFKNALAYRRQRPIISWSFALLELP